MRTIRAWLVSGLALAGCLLAAVTASAGQASRVVLIKADGLPHDEVERAVRERNPRTGKSMLPWIDHVFFQNGTRMSSFYVRGMSLSGPSWSMLDTGQHLQIKGNVEYDRYTQHPYDYLNFFPFWLGSAANRRGDMWGTSVLDDLGLPLLLDAYPFDQRYQSFQLFQRGARWVTLRDGLRKRFTSRTPRQLVDEWYLGIDMRGILSEQLERELLQKLQDPRVRYLDYYTTDFDHAAHHNRDHPAHLAALQELDAIVGRVWTAIRRTPEAADTVLVLVSDHGVNSDERVYSQGYNLVNLLASRSGGGHHVVTKRRLMKDYSIKGIYPLVPLITTTSDESLYLTGLSDTYPTALVDFDGNERASIHLRNATLNVLQILFSQLQRRDLSADLREAATEAFLSVIDGQRPAWQQIAAEMHDELAALRRRLDERRAAVPPPPDTKSRNRPQKAESDEARQARIRAAARVDTLAREESEYTAYLRTLGRLMSLTSQRLESARIEDVVAPGAMGERNSVFDLQHYVVGPAPGGLVLTPEGLLDFERSFLRIDYFSLFDSIAVRNNVQEGVSSKPVDFVAVRVPCERMESAPREVREAETCIWLNGGLDAQALVVSRFDDDGRLLLRYQPVARLSQDRGGAIHFSSTGWREGLPLRLFEDEQLQIPARDRAAWLDGWHTDLEWLRAAHRARYSNAVVGLHEQLARHDAASLDLDQPDLTHDERLIRRFRLRQRLLVEPDILILASDHWNFDVRGFNPGGNHGSFLRASTHSTLMLAGGERTGIPRGLDVEEPYDSLSFAPTLLRLTGLLDPQGRPAPALSQLGFAAFPGRPIGELFGPTYFLSTETPPENDVSDTIAPPSP